jgi:hypothetical protein
MVMLISYYLASSKTRNPHVKLLLIIEMILESTIIPIEVFEDSCINLILIEVHHLQIQ